MRSAVVDQALEAVAIRSSNSCRSRMPANSRLNLGKLSRWCPSTAAPTRRARVLDGQSRPPRQVAKRFNFGRREFADVPAQQVQCANRMALAPERHASSDRVPARRRRSAAPRPRRWPSSGRPASTARPPGPRPSAAGRGRPVRIALGVGDASPRVWSRPGRRPWRGSRDSGNQPGSFR